jgi:hypothetical protein
LTRMLSPWFSIIYLSMRWFNNAVHQMAELLVRADHISVHP